MGLVKRAATGVLSLACVSALLVGGHWIARTGRHHSSAAPPVQATSLASVPSLIPDCKMPENPPASGPLRTASSTSLLTAGVEGQTDRPFIAADAIPPTVFPAVAAGEPALQPVPARSADARASSDFFGTQPLPLPAHTDAVPLRPEGPELPPIVEPPGSGPATPGLNSPGPNSPGRRIIDHALPNSTPEERELWHNELKDLSPKDVREVMRLLEELGRIPAGQFGPRTPPSPAPPWSQPVPGPIARDPFASQADPPLLLPDAGQEASQTVAASLDAITRAQQVLLNNVANANTDGYKRLIVSLESAPHSPGLRQGNLGSLSGGGVRLGSPIVDPTQGKLRRTGRSLDLAIEGEGYFQLEDRRNGQTYFTRCGRFTVSAKGELVWRTTQRELALHPTVVIGASESELEIGADGRVRIAGAGAEAIKGSGPSGAKRHEDQIQIVRLPASADLNPTGENLFVIRGDVLRDAAASPTRANRLRQGCLEESNVDVEQELRELERLRRQARALEMAEQSLPLSPRDSVIPPGDATTIPSHFAGTPGREPH
jgi:flagellar basal-body rod protein FlgG